VKQGEPKIVEKGLVLAVKNTGKIIRRGVGMPPWKTLVDELTGAPAKK
jgi:hypothetical protein